MGFVKFAIGGFLILGAIVFGISLIFTMPFAIAGGAGWSVIVWGIIAFSAFLGGVYLVRRH